MNVVPLTQLIAQAGIAVPGVSLFVDQMPVVCKTGLLLRGPATGTKIDYELNGYFKTHFQIIARSPRVETSMKLMQDVSRLLTLNRVRLDEFYVQYCRPRTKPITYPLSNGNSIEASAYFDICLIEE